MNGDCSARQINETRAQVSARGLDGLTCPRDQMKLVVSPATGWDMGQGEPVKGGRHGDGREVLAISVECPICRLTATGISLVGIGGAG